MQVPSGHLLIQQGQIGQDVYLLEHGSACVFRGQEAASQSHLFLDAPTILGEMAMADPERIRTSSVVALSDLSLLQIPITTFLIFVRSYPALKEKLRDLIAARSRKLLAKVG
jgi:CRP-like cAMP-binding protein